MDNAHKTCLIFLTSLLIARQTIGLKCYECQYLQFPDPGNHLLKYNGACLDPTGDDESILKDCPSTLTHCRKSSGRSPHFGMVMERKCSAATDLDTIDEMVDEDCGRISGELVAGVAVTFHRSCLCAEGNGCNDEPGWWTKAASSGGGGGDDGERSRTTLRTMFFVSVFIRWCR